MEVGRTPWPVPEDSDKHGPDWRWRLQFLHGYLTGFRATPGPHTAIIDVTNRCNLKCFACPRHAADVPKSSVPDEDFSWEQFQRLCPELQSLGVAKMVFIGQGEPLLHPHLADMVRLAKGCGFRLILVSNGTLLDASHCDAFISAPLDELRVSLWASTPEEYARNCVGNDGRLFSRVVARLRDLRGRRRGQGCRLPKLTLHRPIDRDSFRGLEAMVELAREAGCDALSFSPLKPVTGPHHERGLNPDEVAELLPILRRIDTRARAVGLSTNVRDAIQRYRIGEDVWQSMPCYMGWIDVRIRTNGDVLACGTCRESLGNVQKQSLREIWNGAGFQHFRAATRGQRDFVPLAASCDCGYCCHALSNARLHRVLRWLPRRISNSFSEGT